MMRKHIACVRIRTHDPSRRRIQVAASQLIQQSVPRGHDRPMQVGIVTRGAHAPRQFVVIDDEVPRPFIALDPRALPCAGWTLNQGDTSTRIPPVLATLIRSTDVARSASCTQVRRFVRSSTRRDRDDVVNVRCELLALRSVDLAAMPVALKDGKSQ
jgi:hypothetical protein